MNADGGRFGGLMAAHVVVVGGSGGVGKTTMSAAIAVALARRGRRVLVVTVDPARRLGQALGLGGRAGADDGVDDGVTADGGGGADSATIVTVPAEPGLWATMLDTKAGWDDLVRRHARDADTARRILANPLYHNITGRFVNSHDYIAMETLHRLANDERFEVVVVDTPPSRNALDLLDAPRRMREFFSGRLLRWLTVPYRNRVLGLVSRPFMVLADRVLGAKFLADIGEFFALLGTMEEGFVVRAGEVEQLLRSDGTLFVTVTTAEPAPAIEAGALVAEVRRRGMTPWAVVANRLVPFADPAALVVPGVDELRRITGDDDTSRLERIRDAAGLAAGEAVHVARRNDAVLGDLAATGVPLVLVRSAVADDPLDEIVDQLCRQ